jgi:hypothetical protein
MGNQAARSLTAELASIENEQTAQLRDDFVSMMEDVLDSAEGITLDELAIQVVQMPPSLPRLLEVIRRACSELQDMGTKSERIALQLLTAAAEVQKDIAE